LALLVFAVAVADVAIFAVAGYARTSLTHVRLSISSDEEIVQVFVNCQLAYLDNGQSPAAETPDLGWIAKSDIVTFQVRSLQAPGYYQVAFSHDSHTVQVQARGMPSDHVLLAQDRVVYKSSFVAATGAPLGGLGCQTDASPQLAFADSSAGGRWGGGPQAAFVVADTLARIVPWVLAVFGAIFLVFVAVFDRVKQGHGPTVRIVVAAIDTIFFVVLSLWAQDFVVAAAFCIAAGIGALLAGLYWLLAEDLRRIAARWIERKPPSHQPLDTAAVAPPA
jgi:hypothetical protein